MKRAIITGFEPFGPYQFNPTQDIATEYNGRRVSDIEILGLVLPSTYYGASEVLFDEISKLYPDMVLSSGLASSVRRFRIEAVGRNIMNGKYADATGRRPDNEPIDLTGPAHYTAPSNAVYLASLLHEQGLPAEVSVDAEGFICNSLVYLISQRLQEFEFSTRFAFLHTPWTDDYLDRTTLGQGKITVRKDDLKKAVETLVNGLSANPF